LIGQPARHHHAYFVELGKRLIEFATGGQFNRLPVSLDMFALVHGFTACRVLTANVAQFNGPDSKELKPVLSDGRKLEPNLTEKRLMMVR